MVHLHTCEVTMICLFLIFIIININMIDSEIKEADEFDKLLLLNSTYSNYVDHLFKDRDACNIDIIFESNPNDESNDNFKCQPICDDTLIFHPDDDIVTSLSSKTLIFALGSVSNGVISTDLIIVSIEPIDCLQIKLNVQTHSKLQTSDMVDISLI